MIGARAERRVLRAAELPETVKIASLLEKTAVWADFPNPKAIYHFLAMGRHSYCRSDSRSIVTN